MDSTTTPAPLPGLRTAQLQELLSRSARGMRFSAIRRMSALIQRPGVISFAPGQPSADTFPLDEIRAIADAILGAEGTQALQYILTRGHGPLIEAVRTYAAAKDIAATAAETIITEGSQQGLDL